MNTGKRRHWIRNEGAGVIEGKNAVSESQLLYLVDRVASHRVCVDLLQQNQIVLRTGSDTVYALQITQRGFLACTAGSLAAVHEKVGLCAKSCVADVPAENA